MAQKLLPINLPEMTHDKVNEIKGDKSKVATICNIVDEHHQRVTNPRSPDVIVDRFDLFVLLGVCNGMGIDLNEYPSLVAAVKGLEAK